MWDRVGGVGAFTPTPPIVSLVGRVCRAALGEAHRGITLLATPALARVRQIHVLFHRLQKGGEANHVTHCEAHRDERVEVALRDRGILRDDRLASVVEHDRLLGIVLSRFDDLRLKDGRSLGDRALVKRSGSDQKRTNIGIRHMDILFLRTFCLGFWFHRLTHLL